MKTSLSLAIILLLAWPLTGQAVGVPEFLLPETIEEPGPDMEPLPLDDPEPVPLDTPGDIVGPPAPDPAPSPPASGNAQADAAFKAAYEALVKADQARAAERMTDALNFYVQALRAYKTLSERYPNRETGIVKFRASYCDSQIRELRKRKLRKTAPPPSDNSVQAPAPPGDSNGSTATSTTAPAHPVPANASLPDLLAQARALLNHGKSDQARVTLIQALRINPDHPDTRVLIAMAQCQVGNFEDAVFVLKPLIEEHPDNVHAHLTLGAAQLGLGRLDDAAASLNKALDIDPKLKQAHYNLARLLLAGNPPNIPGAKDHYKKALLYGAERDHALEDQLERRTTPGPSPK